uniref:Putative ovule protein n=1 Tax=Solanum chacoense TaxID=4108 RepID=A0A0V0GU41_SOLCH
MSLSSNSSSVYAELPKVWSKHLTYSLKSLTDSFIPSKPMFFKLSVLKFIVREYTNSIFKLI